MSSIKQIQVNYLNQLKTIQKSKRQKMLIYMMVLLLLKFMYWLKTNIGKIEMDELSISNKLLEFRKQQPNFKDISFTTICAYRENAALMHYTSNRKTIL